MWPPPFVDPVRVASVHAAQKLFGDCFLWSDWRVEQLWVAHLDHERRCLYLDCFSGGRTEAPMPTADIVAGVIEHKSKGLLLAHNHPSGDPRPSHADIQTTRRLATVIEGADCRLHDHLISAGTSWTSFRESGLL